MTKTKIEGFNKGRRTEMVTINGVNSPALYTKRELLVPISWGDCSDESRNLARMIVSLFIKQKYQNQTSCIEIMARKFVEHFIIGWGDGNFSIEVNMREFFRKQGYRHYYKNYKKK